MAKIVLPKTQSPASVKKADQANLVRENAAVMPPWIPTAKEFRSVPDGKFWDDLSASQRNKWRVAGTLAAWRDAAISPCLQGKRPGVEAAGKFLYLWTNTPAVLLRQAWKGVTLVEGKATLPAWQLTPNDAPPVQSTVQNDFYAREMIEDFSLMGDMTRVLSGWLYQGHRTATWAATGSGHDVVVPVSGNVNPSEIFYALPTDLGTPSAWEVYIWWSAATWPQFGMEGNDGDGSPPPPPGMTLAQLAKEKVRVAGMLTPWAAWETKPDPAAVMVFPATADLQQCPIAPDGYDVRDGTGTPKGNVLFGYQSAFPSRCVKGQMAYAPGVNNPYGVHPSGRKNLARILVQHRASGFWFLEDRAVAYPVSALPVIAKGAGFVFQAIGPQM